MNDDADDAWIRFLLAEGLPSPIETCLRACLDRHGLERAIAVCVVGEELQSAFHLDEDEVDALLGVVRPRANADVIVLRSPTPSQRRPPLFPIGSAAPWPLATRSQANVKGTR